jgi:hypothetical protein
MRTRASAAIGGVIVLVLGLAGRAAAQDGVRVTGHVEADHVTYFESGATDGAGRQEMLAQIDGRAPLGRRVRLFGSVEVRGDFANHNRDRVHVDELYADFEYGRFDLRAGRQVISWGKSDVVNPTDHLSPRDFTDPLESDDERLGVFAVRPRVQLGAFQWEGVIIPVFTASTMPVRGTRWAPAPAFVASARLAPAPPREPATTLGNMQYATRVSGSVRGYDVSAMYFDGWNELPPFGRKRVIGGDVATVVGPYTLRAEGAHIRPDSRQGPDHFQYVVGAERSFGDLMGSGGTFVLAQWIQTVLPGGFTPAPFDFDYLFEQAAMLRVQHNVTAAVRFGAEGLYEFARGGYYLQPSVSYRFGGRVRTEALVDLLGGKQAEFFGMFATNKRVQLRVRYSF